MVQTEPMAKDKTFNLRLDEDDRKRLEMLSEHYSAPLATVVRIIIKNEIDRLGFGGLIKWMHFYNKVNEMLKLAGLGKVEIFGHHHTQEGRVKERKREPIVHTDSQDVVPL